MKKSINPKNLFIHKLISNGWTLERYSSVICIYDKEHKYIGVVSKDYGRTFAFSFIIGADDDGRVYNTDKKIVKLAKELNANINYRVKVCIV